MPRFLALVLAASYSQREGHLRQGVAVEVSPAAQLQVELADPGGGHKDVEPVELLPEQTAETSKSPEASNGAVCNDAKGRDWCLEQLSSTEHLTCADEHIFGSCKELCAGCGNTCSDKVGFDVCQGRIKEARAKGLGNPCSAVETVTDCMLSCEKCSVREDGEEEENPCDPDDPRDDPGFKDLLGSTCESYYAGTEAGLSKCTQQDFNTPGFIGNKPIKAGFACCKSCARKKVDIEVTDEGQINFTPYSVPEGNCETVFEDDPNWRDAWDDDCSFYGQTFESNGVHKARDMTTWSGVLGDGPATRPETNCDRFGATTVGTKNGAVTAGLTATQACCKSCKRTLDDLAHRKADGDCQDDEEFQVCNEPTCSTKPTAEMWACSDFGKVPHACADKNFGATMGLGAGGKKMLVREACCFSCGSDGVRAGGAHEGQGTMTPGAVTPDSQGTAGAATAQDGGLSATGGAQGALSDPDASSAPSPLGGSDKLTG